jgi:hypothetical protein
MEWMGLKGWKWKMEGLLGKNGKGMAHYMTVKEERLEVKFNGRTGIKGVGSMWKGEGGVERVGWEGMD